MLEYKQVLSWWWIASVEQSSQLSVQLRVTVTDVLLLVLDYTGCRQFFNTISYCSVSISLDILDT